MEQLVTCSLAGSGVKCGEYVYLSSDAVVMVVIVMGVLAVLLTAILAEYSDKRFKKRIRDLGYGYVLEEADAAYEKFIPTDKDEHKGTVITKSKVIKAGREVP